MARGIERNDKILTKEKCWGMRGQPEVKRFVQCTVRCKRPEVAFFLVNYGRSKNVICINFLKSLDFLTKEEKDLIFYKNAKTFLGLEDKTKSGKWSVTLQWLVAYPCLSDTAIYPGAASVLKRTSAGHIPACIFRTGSSPAKHRRNTDVIPGQHYLSNAFVRSGKHDGLPVALPGVSVKVTTRNSVAQLVAYRKTFR